MKTNDELAREFLDFEQIAMPYAENFLCSNACLLESACGLNKTQIKVKDLKMVYVMYEYLFHKSNSLEPIQNENELKNVLASADKNEYIRVLKKYCNNCGNFVCDSYDSFNVIKHMTNYVKIQKNELDYLNSSSKQTIKTIKSL